jgi:hypothetical protein
MKLRGEGFCSAELWPTFRGASFGPLHSCSILTASYGTRHCRSPVCCSEESSTRASPALARHLHARDRKERGGTRLSKRIKARKSEHPRIFRRDSPLDRSLSTSSLIRGIAKTFGAILDWLKLSGGGFLSREYAPDFRGASFELIYSWVILTAS